MNDSTENTRLNDLSEALAANIRAVSGSIVRVEARRRGNASGIAWSADGLVITAHHTVQRDEDLRIGIEGGDIVPATLVGRDPTTDVAVLRATGASLTPPRWASAEELHVGNLVVSVGRHDANTQAGMGIVAKKDGVWRTQIGGAVSVYLETDIAVYPGFSGSALVGTGGSVYGMNTSWFGRRLSLTLPHDTLARTVRMLVEHGQVRRAFLGVGAHPVPVPASAAEAVEQKTGLLVVGIEAGSPAESAGLIVGDLILALDGEPTPRLDSLQAALTDERIGRAVSLRVLRGGKPEELAVTPGEQ